MRRSEKPREFCFPRRHVCHGVGKNRRLPRPKSCRFPSLSQIAQSKVSFSIFVCPIMPEKKREGRKREMRKRKDTGERRRRRTESPRTHQYSTYCAKHADENIKNRTKHILVFKIYKTPKKKAKEKGAKKGANFFFFFEMRFYLHKTTSTLIPALACLVIKYCPPHPHSPT